VVLERFQSASVRSAALPGRWQVRRYPLGVATVGGSDSFIEMQCQTCSVPGLQRLRNVSPQGRARGTPTSPMLAQHISIANASYHYTNIELRRKALTPLSQAVACLGDGLTICRPRYPQVLRLCHVGSANIQVMLALQSAHVTGILYRPPFH
jgi:hypothetical protein